jgi:hypothetical protein
MQRDILSNEIAHLNPGKDAEAANPSSLKMRKESGAGKTKLQARIVWPALGFPAVISPRQNSTSTPMKDGDASKCICVLLLSNQQYLSKEDAARYLRYVPWEDRSRRHIAAGQTGSFAETDIEVKNDFPDQKLTGLKWKDLHGTGISFGGTHTGGNAITVKLADYVKNFYGKNGLLYLHEIRIFERVSAQLKDGQYNLFWNSDSVQENAPSAEIKLLLDRYALPKREKDVLWDTQPKFLLGEYEYEYGSLQKPYRSELQMRYTRTEILHPLFVKPSNSDGLKIGHITDAHVCVRSNVYEENLKKENLKKGKNKKVQAQYNNWNKSFVEAYGRAKKTSDIILFTGDLIDYGRGHWGLTAHDRLGEDRLYHADRNWFLFYYLMASGDSYQTPTYTILGNHDWRLNPYPPFAVAGAPLPTAFFHNHVALDTDSDKRKEKEPETKRLLRIAHDAGEDMTRGSERKFTYHSETDADFIKKFWEDGSLLKTVGKIIAQKKTLDEPHLPVETTVESIGWYLMAINPFLDYSFSLPGGQKVLMLDWAEDEDLFFQLNKDGKEWPFMPWEIKKATAAPKARNSLTTVQKKLIEELIQSKGNSKIIGIHTPPIGPYADWSDLDLMKGRKIYGPKEKARGSKNYATRKPDGSVEKWNGHPIFAVLPSESDYGAVADCGSFSRERDWFIKKMTDPASGVRAIFAGHNHRDGLYVVHTPTEKEKLGPALTGKMLVKSLLPPSQSTVRTVGLETFPYKYPLYINTTSAGPRGDFYARKIEESEAKKGGLTINPGYTQVEMKKNGAISSVKFLSI